MKKQSEELTTPEIWARKFTGAISMVAIAGILTGAIVIVIDVLGRWLFGSAVYALNEIMSLTFAVAVAATMPAGAAHRVNLRLDLFAQLTSPRLSGWLNVVASVMLLLFYGVLAWSLYGIASKYGTQGRATALLVLPLTPIYYAIATSMAAAAIVQIVSINGDIQRTLRETSKDKSHPIVLVLVAILAFAVLTISYFAIFDPDLLMDFVQMHPGVTVLIGFVMLWLGVFAQIPLATVTAGIGIMGTFGVIGFDASVNTFSGDAASFLRNDQVATLPLFLIMGAFAVVAGVSSDLFRLGHVLLGRFRGGLAYATIAGCAGFGAVSGNSIVTSATFGRMALPEMKKLGYAPTLSTATVAAGGTLGALVPPSGVIILFALLTEESIGKLFIAAMIPAVLAIVLYFSAVFITVAMNREAAPTAEKASLTEIRDALLGAGPVVALFGIVIGGLYSGIFTVTESAAVGAACAFLLAFVRGRLTRESILNVFSETTGTVAMIYALIFGGLMFGFFVNLGGAPDMVGAWISSLDAKPIVVLLVLIIIYLLLGSVMDSFGVMIITLPVVTPIVLDLGYDMVFWGILMLVVVEIGMITPPFGMNLFILKNIDPTVRLTTVMRGVLPFVTADLVKIILLVAFPALSLWLPSTMG